MSEGHEILWQHIVAFYDHDKKYTIKAALKLTDSHLKPNNFEKMKVKFATQLFSQTTAAALNLYVRFGVLPASAAYTAAFIEKNGYVEFL